MNDQSPQEHLPGLRQADVPVCYATGETRIPRADERKSAAVGQLTDRFRKRY